MLVKPPEGAIVTIVTRHKDHYRHAEKPYFFNEYKNVRVLNYNDNLLGPDDIKIEWPNKDGFTIVNLNNIVTLQVGGKTSTPSEPTFQSERVVSVAGSKGATYAVVVKNGRPISCTCPQFTIRKQKCKHIIGLENK